MELLEVLEPSSYTIAAIERAVQTSFWCHNPVIAKYVHGNEWRERLHESLGIAAPDWAWMNDTPCAVHGDPTLCNVLMRGTTLVLSDPVYPTRVPQIAATDQARIVQSLMGWEVMTGYHVPRDPNFQWREPAFLYTSDQRTEVIAFWTMVMLARIAAPESSVSDSERAWAAHGRDQLAGAVA